MADSKITALTAISTVDPAADPLVIVDVSDTSMAASGTTKKATINQLLGASGTATLASATVTGDLTVDTSTLKVDSANNRVIVGHTTGSAPFQVTNAGGAGLEIQPTGVNSNPVLLSYNRGTSSYGQLTLDASSIVHNLSGSTAMTLNSTGLGVGGSPTRKLSIVGSGATYANINSGDNTSLVGLLLGGTSTPSAGQLIYDNTANSLSLFTSGSSRLLIDSSGNVGIGVTPSAWNSSAKAFEIGTAGNSVFSSGATFVEMTNNAYLDSVSNWNRVNTGNAAARFRTSGSGFLWLQAAAGANPITWTTAMQLDSNGNLILQSSATPATLTTNGQLTVNATSNTNLRFSYRGSDGVTRVANITLA